MRRTAPAACFVFILIIGFQPVFADTKFTVGVDPRVEIISIIQLLSEMAEDAPFLVSGFDSFAYEYKKNALTHFSKFAEHKAVKMFNKRWSANGNFGPEVEVAIRLGPSPAFEQIIELPESCLEMMLGEQKLQEFLQALRDFAVESDFVDFFERNQEFYLAIENRTKDTLGDMTPATLENYYGAKQNSHSIIIVPLLGGVGYGPRVERGDSSLDIYNIMGPQKLEEGLPDFGTVEYFRSIVWHEFGHSFVNPIVFAHTEEVAKYESLYDSVKDLMSRQGYNDWTTAVCEHLVEAVVTRIMCLELSEEASIKQMESRISRGYIYVDELAEFLKTNYEPNRGKYPTFESFFPELLKVFDAAMAER